MADHRETSRRALEAFNTGEFDSLEGVYTGGLCRPRHPERLRRPKSAVSTSCVAKSACSVPHLRTSR